MLWGCPRIHDLSINNVCVPKLLQFRTKSFKVDHGAAAAKTCRETIIIFKYLLICIHFMIM